MDLGPAAVDTNLCSLGKHFTPHTCRLGANRDVLVAMCKSLLSLHPFLGKVRLLNSNNQLSLGVKRMGVKRS